jgi:hypothetical protein
MECIFVYEVVLISYASVIGARQSYVYQVVSIDNKEYKDYLLAQPACLVLVEWLCHHTLPSCHHNPGQKMNSTVLFIA